MTNKVKVMAGGWSRDGAVQEQIDDTVSDAVAKARGRLANGAGRKDCIECGEDIPEARRLAMPGATTCVACQSLRDRRPTAAGINRRANKDSQLR
ncbi:MAG TPA: DksA/TraR family C4-type zinc finger protein [Pseudorhodoplanes sp.]|nr:DksA/TraR family C4-type zinc finger protein [Pseudorhodoplanes sp.]HWV55474.1 DksA/TraR family C4-type zinc finger protein [Pseudorhodoplanes sp.]